MKLETNTQKISSAINKLKINKNTTLPILENIILSAKDNILLMKVTNLNVGVEVSIPAKVEREGEIALKYEIFSQIINSLKTNGKISLEKKDNTLSIKTEDSVMDIHTYDASEFPIIPRVEDKLSFSLPIEKIIDGIKSVFFAASLSEIKPEISSVYIYHQDNELVFVSTDSFRLAEKRIILNNVEDFPGVIIPIKNIQELIRVFQNIEGEVLWEISDTQINLSNDEIFFSSRVIDGNYPDYKQIIPQEEKTSAVLLKEDFITALKLTNIFSDKFHQIHLKVDSKKNTLSVHSKNLDVGVYETKIESVVEGDDIDIYVNVKYITDLLSRLNADSIQLSFTEKNKPFVIKAIGDTSFLYLVMPMNR